MQCKQSFSCFLFSYEGRNILLYLHVSKTEHGIWRKSNSFSLIMQCELPCCKGWMSSWWVQGKDFGWTYYMCWYKHLSTWYLFEWWPMFGGTQYIQMCMPLWLCWKVLWRYVINQPPISKEDIRCIVWFLKMFYLVLLETFSRKKKLYHQRLLLSLEKNSKF